MPTKSGDFEATLSKSEIHEKWIQSFRTAETEPFYREAFKKIAEIVQFKPGGKLLDAGCGTCSHSIRLAKHKLSITAVDSSRYVVDEATRIVESNHLQNKINVMRKDLTDLDFENETFDYVLCWGVLMHIPDIENAILETCRVVKEDGFLIVSEGNFKSFQSTVELLFLKNNKSDKVFVETTEKGIEINDKQSGKLIFRRHDDIKWLKKFICERNFVVISHFSGQFT